MSDDFVIKLSELTDIGYEELYREHEFLFTGEEQFADFLDMQSKYYHNGIKYSEFLENTKTFALNVAMNGLRQKLGLDAIKEHTTDDGDTFYSLGMIPENLNIGELNDR